MSCAEVYICGIWFETGPESEFTMFNIFPYKFKCICPAWLISVCGRKSGLLDLLHIYERLCIICYVKCLVHGLINFPASSWILKTSRPFFLNLLFLKADKIN